MERQPLKSRSVTSAGYDSVSRELEIEFATGRIYRFKDVPPGVFEWLLRTGNKGSYVSRMINDHYDYREITPPPADQDLVAELMASLAAKDEEV